MRIMLKEKDFDPTLDCFKSTQNQKVLMSTVLTYWKLISKFIFRLTLENIRAGAKLFQSAHIADWVKEIKKKLPSFVISARREVTIFFLEGVFS